LRIRRGSGAARLVSRAARGHPGAVARTLTSSVVLNSPSYDPTVGTAPGIIGMTISGYVRPAEIGPGTPGCAGLDDGDYCGGDDIGGDPNTLYQCTSGSLSVLTVCANGCLREPGTQNDQCQ
jgi:hypothetical protein